MEAPAAGSTSLQGAPNDDKEPNPPIGPPSPLSGAYLLLVIGEPRSEEDKQTILEKITKGFLSWDVDSCHVDLEKELKTLTSQAPEGEEAKNGERLIQYASETLVTEVLIHPQLNTMVQCIRNLLSSFTRHRHIIHAGYTFAHSGSWILQDGTFSLADFVDAFQETEVQRVLRAYENTVTVNVHCSTEGEWNTQRLAKEQLGKLCKVTINPPDKLSTGSEEVKKCVEYLGQFLNATSLEQLLEPSDIVGNIRFSHPTLYVFPGGQGDAALFGINGFNMLVDGGFSRRASFWNFVRHLDRLDAVLMTRINNCNINGISSLVRRKKITPVYPQIGHFFCNLQERKTQLHPEGDKERNRLLINLFDEGHDMVQDLRFLHLRPHQCYRENVIEPINLYHKVGHGKLDMYVLSPAKDNRDVKEFISKWNSGDAKLFGKKLSDKDNFPLPNIVSICALLIWQPANPSDTITRILFPGSAPQHKILEGFEKIKHLEFLRHPVCTAKSLSPSVSAVNFGRSSSKQRPQSTVVDKGMSGDSNKTKNAVIELGEKPVIKSSTGITTSQKTVSGMTNGTGKKIIKTESKKADNIDGKQIIKESTNIIKADETLKDNKDKIETKSSSIFKSDDKIKSSMEKKDQKSTENNIPAKVKTEKNRFTEKKTIGTERGIKSPPETLKKMPENKINGKTEINKIKTSLKTRSPSATPAKSTKEENNRKVVEAKVTTTRTVRSTSKPPQPAKKPITKKEEEKKEINRPTSTKFEHKIISKRKESPEKSKEKTKSESKTFKTVKSTKIAKKREDKVGSTGSSVASTPSTVENETLIKTQDLKIEGTEQITSVEEKVDAVTTIKQETIISLKNEENISGDGEIDEILIIEKIEMVHDDEINQIASTIKEDVTIGDELEEKELTVTTETELQKQTLDQLENEKQTVKELINHEISMEDGIKVKELLAKGEVKQEISSKKVEVILTPENKEQLAGEVDEIITSATDTVSKNEKEALKQSSEVSLEEQKDGTSESPEKPLTPEKNTDEKLGGLKEKSKEKEVESQPDEKISTTGESGATTAPTMPEDERIPLDDINEIIEEKHIREETKEKDLLLQKPDVKPESELIRQPVQSIKDIVKTPDEVADLPIHEEVDPRFYHDFRTDSTKASESAILQLPIENKKLREVNEKELMPSAEGAKDEVKIEEEKDLKTQRKTHEDAERVMKMDRKSSEELEKMEIEKREEKHIEREAAEKHEENLTSKISLSKADKQEELQEEIQEKVEEKIVGITTNGRKEKEPCEKISLSPEKEIHKHLEDFHKTEEKDGKETKQFKDEEIKSKKDLSIEKEVSFEKQIDLVQEQKMSPKTELIDSEEQKRVEFEPSPKQEAEKEEQNIDEKETFDFHDSKEIAEKVEIKEKGDDERQEKRSPEKTISETKFHEEPVKHDTVEESPETLKTAEKVTTEEKIATEGDSKISEVEEKCVKEYSGGSIKQSLELKITEQVLEAKDITEKIIEAQPEFKTLRPGHAEYVIVTPDSTPGTPKSPGIAATSDFKQRFEKLDQGKSNKPKSLEDDSEILEILEEKSEIKIPMNEVTEHELELTPDLGKEDEVEVSPILSIEKTSVSLEDHTTQKFEAQVPEIIETVRKMSIDIETHAKDHDATLTEVPKTAPKEVFKKEMDDSKIYTDDKKSSLILSSDKSDKYPSPASPDKSETSSPTPLGDKSVKSSDVLSPVASPKIISPDPLFNKIIKSSQPSSPEKSPKSDQNSMSTSAPSPTKSPVTQVKSADKYEEGLKVSSVIHSSEKEVRSSSSTSLEGSPKARSPIPTGVSIKSSVPTSPSTSPKPSSPIPLVEASRKRSSSTSPEKSAKVGSSAPTSEKSDISPLPTSPCISPKASSPVPENIVDSSSPISHTENTQKISPVKLSEKGSTSPTQNLKPSSPTPISNKSSKASSPTSLNGILKPASPIPPSDKDTKSPSSTSPEKILKTSSPDLLADRSPQSAGLTSPDKSPSAVYSAIPSDKGTKSPGLGSPEKSPKPCSPAPSTDESPKAPGLTSPDEGRKSIHPPTPSDEDARPQDLASPVKSSKLSSPASLSSKSPQPSDQTSPNKALKESDPILETDQVAKTLISLPDESPISLLDKSIKSSDQTSSDKSPRISSPITEDDEMAKSSGPPSPVKSPILKLDRSAKSSSPASPDKSVKASSPFPPSDRSAKSSGPASPSKSSKSLSLPADSDSRASTPTPTPGSPKLDAVLSEERLSRSTSPFKDEKIKETSKLFETDQGKIEEIISEKVSTVDHECSSESSIINTISELHVLPDAEKVDKAFLVDKEKKVLSPTHPTKTTHSESFVIVETKSLEFTESEIKKESEIIKPTSVEEAEKSSVTSKIPATHVGSEDSEKNLGNLEKCSSKTDESSNGTTSVLNYKTTSPQLIIDESKDTSSKSPEPSSAEISSITVTSSLETGSFKKVDSTEKINVASDSQNSSTIITEDVRKDSQSENPQINSSSSSKNAAEAEVVLKLDDTSKLTSSELDVDEINSVSSIDKTQNLDSEMEKSLDKTSFGPTALLEIKTSGLEQTLDKKDKFVSPTETLETNQESSDVSTEATTECLTSVEKITENIVTPLILESSSSILLADDSVELSSSKSSDLVLSHTKPSEEFDKSLGPIPTNESHEKLSAPTEIEETNSEAPDQPSADEKVSKDELEPSSKEINQKTLVSGVEEKSSFIENLEIREEKTEHKSIAESLEPCGPILIEKDQKITGFELSQKVESSTGPTDTISSVQIETIVLKDDSVTEPEAPSSFTAAEISSKQPLPSGTLEEPSHKVDEEKDNKSPFTFTAEEEGILKDSSEEKVTKLNETPLTETSFIKEAGDTTSTRLLNEEKDIKSPSEILKESSVFQDSTLESNNSFTSTLPVKATDEKLSSPEKTTELSSKSSSPIPTHTTESREIISPIPVEEGKSDSKSIPESKISALLSTKEESEQQTSLTKNIQLDLITKNPSLFETSTTSVSTGIVDSVPESPYNLETNQISSSDKITEEFSPTKRAEKIIESSILEKDINQRLAVDEKGKSPSPIKEADFSPKMPVSPPSNVDATESDLNLKTEKNISETSLTGENQKSCTDSSSLRLSSSSSGDIQTEEKTCQVAEKITSKTVETENFISHLDEKNKDKISCSKEQVISGASPVTEEASEKIDTTDTTSSSQLIFKSSSNIPIAFDENEQSAQVYSLTFSLKKSSTSTQCIEQNQKTSPTLSDEEKEKILLAPSSETVAISTSVSQTESKEQLGDKGRKVGKDIDSSEQEEPISTIKSYNESVELLDKVSSSDNLSTTVSTSEIFPSVDLIEEKDASESVIVSPEKVTFKAKTIIEEKSSKSFDQVISIKPEGDLKVSDTLPKSTTSTNVNLVTVPDVTDSSQTSEIGQKSELDVQPLDKTHPLSVTSNSNQSSKSSSPLPYSNTSSKHDSPIQTNEMSSKSLSPEHSSKDKPSIPLFSEKLSQITARSSITDSKLDSCSMPVLCRTSAPSPEESLTSVSPISATDKSSKPISPLPLSEEAKLSFSAEKSSKSIDESAKLHSKSNSPEVDEKQTNLPISSDSKRTEPSPTAPSEETSKSLARETSILDLNEIETETESVIGSPTTEMDKTAEVASSGLLDSIKSQFVDDVQTVVTQTSTEIKKHIFDLSSTLTGDERPIFSGLSTVNSCLKEGVPICSPDKHISTVMIDSFMKMKAEEFLDKQTNEEVQTTVKVTEAVSAPKIAEKALIDQDRIELTKKSQEVKINGSPEKTQSQIIKSKTTIGMITESKSDQGVDEKINKEESNKLCASVLDDLHQASGHALLQNKTSLESYINSTLLDKELSDKIFTSSSLPNMRTEKEGFAMSVKAFKPEIDDNQIEETSLTYVCTRDETKSTEAKLSDNKGTSEVKSFSPRRISEDRHFHEELAYTGGIIGELRREARSSTPGSEMSDRDYELGDRSTPHSDISSASGQVGRTGTYAWRPGDSDEESDGKALGSPMSAASHVTHSPAHSESDKEGQKITVTMTSSCYGTLPGQLSAQETRLAGHDMCSSVYLPKDEDEEEVEDYDYTIDPHYSSTEYSKQLSLKGEEITDFDKAIKEHRLKRGEDLGTYIEFTKYSSNSRKDTDSEDTHHFSEDFGNGNISMDNNINRSIPLEHTGSTFGTDIQETTTYTIGQQIYSEETTTLPTTTSTSQIDDNSKDPIGGWGKPLGLPPPPNNINNRNKRVLIWNPVEEWGKPLGLPSPAPPPVKQESDGDIQVDLTLLSNKTTPKKSSKKSSDHKSVSGGWNGKEGGKAKRNESPMKYRSWSKDGRSNKSSPIYIDLAYVPHHGNSLYSAIEFFKKIRARYYVVSAIEPSSETFDALLEAKQSWEDKESEVTIIPTYDTDALGYWVTENEDLLAKNKIDLSPSASRCTINLQDHETSCSAYRLEF